MDRVRRYLEGTEDLVVGVPRATSIADQIAAWIRDQIQFGTFKPGEPLREIPLAERFGVSRGPVRDALKMLHREGLIDLGVRTGATVRQQADADLVAIFRIRAETTGLTMRLAAEQANPKPGHSKAISDGVKTLVALAVDRDASVSDYILVRRRLSTIINLVADAPYLSRLGLELELEIALHWAAMVGKGRQMKSSQGWSRIGDAILNGQPEIAEAEGRQIVLDSLQELLIQRSGQGAAG